MTIDELQSEYAGLEIKIDGVMLSIRDNITGLVLKTRVSDNSLDCRDLIERNSIMGYTDSGYISPQHAELLISQDFFRKVDSESFEYKFSINSNHCRIARPSHLFELIMSELVSDKYWDPSCVLTLTVSSEQEIEPDNDIINALFWAYIALGPNEPSENQETQSYSFPCVSKFYGYYGCLHEESDGLYADFISRFNTEISSRQFPKSKYFEPLSFYSSGKFSNDVNISFLQYYKVLEYFFIFQKRTEIEEIIDSYKKHDEFPQFVKSMKSILNYKEEQLLTEVLNTFCVSVIDDILKTARDEKLIQRLGTDDLSKQLYAHRNSIAHGKETFENDTITLSGLVESADANIAWCNICERCALYVLSSRCFDRA